MKSLLGGGVVSESLVGALFERNCGVSWDSKEDKIIERISFLGAGLRGSIAQDTAAQDIG